MNDPFRTNPLTPETCTAPETTPCAGNHPQQIGRYRIDAVLGQGGFGLVYLAFDDQLKRNVAIKVPNSHLVALPESAEAYLAEARTVAGLDHPHIVPVYDVGSTPEFPYFIVSKFIEGKDLAHAIVERRPSSLEAAELVALVADALHYAHRKKLVHRDIKTSNILLDDAGKPFVADFGLALKEENFGRGVTFAGTPTYMSPEQARGEGHRVDGRSDIFSLGVVFYELLTGQRPFKGEDRTELLDQITSVEPRPPRQIDDAIPKELERICLKALAKRISERYTTARDLADELNQFREQAGKADKATTWAGDAGSDLPRPQTPGPLSPVAFPSPTPVTPIKVVPKGLRSFDAHDAEFFLELLPGPRDRHGLPESLRFWKSRIEARDPDRSFAVGLIYGPSGCGKSSLVKAGLLPRLAEGVTAVYLEATPEKTESRLLKGLRKACPDLPLHLSLVESMTGLRQGQFLPKGQVVLTVLDQFEQWLHGKPSDPNSELARALRQCDGERLKCLLTVRDDFWMSVTRFMESLEVELTPGRNVAAVDLFDPFHARKVLAALGRAFGRLPEAAGSFKSEQEAFLDRAIEELAQDGKIISVRLALFAEMIKSKPWIPATLKEIGGMAGVGVTFLDESFVQPAAPPRQRAHQRAAQAVLKAMLPEIGADIKGNVRSRQDLLAASGYGDQPKDFDTLLHILDDELRLITPTEIENSPDQTQYFQLTHDFLVPSVRDWLTREQKQTRKGRAELRLADRSTAWNVNPLNRHLPAWWEWANIRTYTRPRDWSAAQKKMMRQAAKYHGLRALGAMVLLALVAWGGYEGHGRFKARELREQLLRANTANVPAIVADMGPYRRWINPLLRESYQEAEADHDSRGQLHAALALLAVDSSQKDFLLESALDADPDSLSIIRNELRPHKALILDQLWSVLEQPEKPQRRLRAAYLLAEYDPDRVEWNKFNTAVTNELVAVNPFQLVAWADGLTKASGHLIGPLSAIYRDHRAENAVERTTATSLLARYAANRPEVIADLLMDADPKQFAGLYPVAESQKERAIAVLEAELSKQSIQPISEESEELARRQANAGVALVRLSQDRLVWPLLKQVRVPNVRTELIHRFKLMGTDVLPLVARLGVEEEVSIRRALLLSLGEYGRPASKADKNGPTTDLETPLTALLARIYRDDPDPGIHGAAGWLLIQWHLDERKKEIDKTLATGRTEGMRQWYVNREGQTLSIIPVPGEFQMGSPPEERGRREDERIHAVRIDHSFAMAVTPVTREQFHRFKPEYSFQELDLVCPSKDGPIPGITWYEAAGYCNWLSEKEGLPPEEWCYESNKTSTSSGLGLASNWERRTGYRLPTEAEWECACRAGSVASRYWGSSDEWLDKYAWYLKNSQNKMWPVGRLKPNDFGLFDMQGNALCWCQEAMGGETSQAIPDAVDRILRGGAFVTEPKNLRIAFRFRNRPSNRTLDLGFRVVRTWR